MRGLMRTFKTDGTVEELDLLAPPALDLLQKEVGGYIETVPYWDMLNDEPCVAFCNEMGKLNHLPYNETATWEWHHALRKQGLLPSDALVGDVVVITGDNKLLRSL